MKENLEYCYRKFAEADEPELINLVKKAFPSFLEGNFWVWKYKLNPNFDPSLVVVAEKDGQIVGCNHWLARDFKLSADSKVKASLGGDIIVSPEHRGHKVGKALLSFFRTSKAFKEKGIILTYMFADPALSRRFHQPAVGYVSAPDSTTTYTKFLNSRRLKEKFQLVNDALQSRSDLQQKINGLNMRILFRLRGAPVFSINLADKRVEFAEGDLESPDTIIEGDFTLFSSAIEGKVGLSGLVTCLLTRKLKITKGKSKIFRLFTVFKVFKIAWSLNVKS